MAFQAKTTDKYFLINLLCGLVQKFDENEPVTGTYRGPERKGFDGQPSDIQPVRHCNVTVRHPTFDNGLILACEQAADEHVEEWRGTLQINEVVIRAGKFGYEVEFGLDKLIYREPLKYGNGVPSCAASH